MTIGRRLVATAIALFALGELVDAQRGIVGERQYRLFEFASGDGLAAGLNVAGGQGFRLKAVTSSGDSVTVLMERTTSGAFEYRVVPVFAGRTDIGAISAAAAAGFRLVPRASSTTKGVTWDTVFDEETVVLMEKDPTSGQTFQYRSILAAESAAFEGELRDALANRWTVVDIAADHLLIERPLSASASLSTQAVSPTAGAIPPRPVASPSESPSGGAQTRSTPSLENQPGPAEFVRAGEELEAAARSESNGDLEAALRGYERARALDAALSGGIELSIARMKSRLAGAEAGAEAFRKARQYDALGRRAEALEWYERAIGLLADTDPSKGVAAERLKALRAGRPE